MKILIFGSCVTRDAFTFDKNNLFTLVRYFARSSLATAFDSLKVEDKYTKKLKSAFQQKIVGADLSKEFRNYVTQQDFDYLVIDFINDRYDIFQFNNKSKVLLTAELKQTDFLKRNQSKGIVIEGGSDEWFDEWKKGCIEFIELAKNQDFLHKIILNKVMWTNQLANGEKFIEDDKIEKANTFLERQYEFISKFIPQENIITYSSELFKANKDYMLEQLSIPTLRKDSNKLINKEQIDDSSRDYLDYIKHRIDELYNLNYQQISALDMYQTEKKDYELKLNTLTKELNETKLSLKQTKELLSSTQKKVLATKEQIENTLSFKLGYTLIHSTKSFKNFISLPKDLYALAIIARDRKSYKTTLSSIKPKAKLTNFNKVDSKFKKKYGFKFISILDEISHTSFDSEFKLFPLNKANFESQIKGSLSLGLFIESCWKGNFGAWEYAFTSPNLQHQNAQNLLKALDVCKNRNFPIVFWNKEDPMHYEKFLPISSKCYVIFTTDSNKVKDYQRDVPNAKVETLMFAANINICNPANRFRYEAENICFAGSYYGVGHDDRKKQMDALLPTIIKFKGAIYDRMSQVQSADERYSYPKQYRKFIRPAVPFKEIVDIYKQFKIFLNVNTITDSPTMMSRRVYELLACGTPVISTPSLAIDEQFKGIVQVAKDAKEANKIAKRLLENEWEWLRISHLGYREVMLKHTYEHRAVQIANTLGQDIKPEAPLASIVVASNRPYFIDRIVDNVTNQSYPNIEVIVIAQKYTAEQLDNLKQKLSKSNKLKNVIVVQNDSDDTLGKRLNQGIKLSKGEYVAKFDDDDFYFPNYLQDMLIPFKFGDYGIIGKKEIFIFLESQNKTFVRYKGQRHLETDFLTGATLVFARDALKKLSFGDLNRGEDSNILEQAKKLGIKMYVTDPFNFVVFRSKELSNHTWQVDDNFFTNKGVFVGEELAKDITKL
ncbi:TPA: glycosyltransferase [Mannheimia haemolytica]|nr:glycosyltransferase [Mannheimia haemolytica]HDL4396554.1 glycosyltransferase [Mannheimia haemolytica]